ncbi:MAG: DUF4920 domain-containing protein [Ignavibacteria bacterium]|nr:DUF4920 domain-containing protein [Ignavibacteria bacterium]
MNEYAQGTCRVLLLAAAVVFTSCSEPQDPFADYKLYGGDVEPGPSITVTNLVEAASELEGKSIIVEGIAGSVCQNRGCWMYVTDGDATVRITFKDYAFFVPIGSEGKKVRVEGIVQRKIVSKETLQHWEEEEDGGDPSKITDDQTVIMFEASGVLIQGGEVLSPEQMELMEQG